MSKAVLLRIWRATRDLALIALLVFGARSVIADWNHVPSGSMKPTLLVGDLIFVNRLAYDLKLPFTTWHVAEWGAPRRGEIVVFDSPSDGRLLVKRVIGVPGDTVAMRDNALFINGEPVAYSNAAEPEADELPAAERTGSMFALEHLPDAAHPIMLSRIAATAPAFGPVAVPDNHYLMLGDNRDQSADSRYFGFVPRDAIRGRAIGVIASFNPEQHFLPRGGRFLNGLE